MVGVLNREYRRYQILVALRRFGGHSVLTNSARPIKIVHGRSCEAIPSTCRKKLRVTYRTSPVRVLSLLQILVALHLFIFIDQGLDF